MSALHKAKTLHSNTVTSSWFRGIHYLFLFLSVVCLEEKQQIPILESLAWSDPQPMIYRIRGEHANHYTTDAVCMISTYWRKWNQHQCLISIWKECLLLTVFGFHISFCHMKVQHNYITRVAQRVPLVKQERLTLLEHLSCNEVRVDRSLILYVMFCRSLFVLFFFWLLCCLSVFDLRLLITSLVYCGHCVVCPSSTYGFWLPLWYLVVIVLSVRLRLMASDYLFGILLSLCCLSFFGLRLLITSFVSCGHCVVCPSSTYGFWLPLWYLQMFLTADIVVNRCTIRIKLN